MKLPTKHTLVLAFALALVFPVTAFATNGMNMIGYGAKATGMGGAGVAYPQDAMAAAYNPAGMTEVGQMRLDATIELFYPPRAAFHDAGSPLGDTDVKSHDNLYPIPAIGVVMSDQSTPMALGMAIIGAGLGTNYNQSDESFFDPVGTTPALTGYKRVGVFLMQMQMLPSMAIRVDDNHSIGASLVIAMQTFRAFGLEAFAGLGYTTDKNSLTNKGNDWSFGGGYRLGWLGKFFNKQLNVGINYAPRVHMQKFNEYRGLFANHGEFDIPTNYALGLAYKLTPKTNVAFDVERILWHQISSIGNPGPLASNPAQFYPLCPVGTDNTQCKAGGDLGLGFGWTNQTVYKLGMDYKWSPTLTLRGGLNYGKAPIPEDQVLFNMLAPATTEKHVTFGFTKNFGKDSDFTFTFMRAFKNTICGPTAFGPGGAIVIGSNACISMQQYSLGFAYGLKF